MTNPPSVADYSPETAQMLADVLAALSRDPKELPPLYLYDQRGSELFDQICEAPEYYPTRTELAILEHNMPGIARLIGPEALIIEPGAGSGLKIQLLLDNVERPVACMPLDISLEHLEKSAAELQQRYPHIPMLPVCADFFGPFELPKCPQEPRRRVVFFPGSTIGNMKPDRARELLASLRDLAGPDGGVLVGVDLRKDPRILEPAYNDAGGVSARFAMNYLVRLNSEVDADFDLDAFKYEAPYNAELGRIEMALVSQCDQTVSLDGNPIELAAGDRLHTEYSYKYTVARFASLAASAGLEVTFVWTDPDALFSVQYLTVV